MKIFKISLVVICLVVVLFAILIFTRKKFDSVVTISYSYDYPFESSEARKFTNDAFDLRQDGKYEMAIELLNKSNNIEPNPRVYLDLYTCYTKQDELLKAIQAMDSAILLDSSFWGFYNNRGLIYYKIDQNYNAINDFEKAIQLDSANWMVYSNLALAYKDLNDLNKACEAFGNSMQLGLDLSKYSNQDDLEELEEACK